VLKKVIMREKCEEIFERTQHLRLVVAKGEEVVDGLLRKFIEHFLNVSKRYSLAETTQTPRLRTGRG